MEIICKKINCSGCEACKNVCPVNAISMKQDEKGFLYPEINQSKCIDCKKCQNACTTISKSNFKKPLKIIACKNKDMEIRKTSSSGGCFFELAKKIIEDQGNVYGAAFSNDIKVEHIKATNIVELEKIKKSKYVQSYMGNVFENIQKDIEENKKVLFSGTPCQIEAIKKSLKSENIFYVDVVCHGVPSPGIFEDYKLKLEETFNSKIVNVNFRYKDDRSTQNICVQFENGKEYIANNKDGDEFYNLFFHDLILRRSCYDCKFKNFERVADISLGDFWGYEKGQAKNFGDNQGISLVLINSQKGLEMFEKIKEKLDFMEIEMEECKPYNCFSKINYPENTDEFWREYRENGYKGIIKYV